VIFEETGLNGAYVIVPERLPDARGYFARTFCAAEFQRMGLVTTLVQCSVSFNPRRGTWRGMHYQVAPFEEAKLVRCTRGAAWDVIADLRRDSPTYRQHLALELSAENGRLLYVPPQFAHGFVTLADDTEVSYQMSACYSSEHARGFRWNDPAFGIELPVPVNVISERDRNYADFET
jgi:dTDP-4-dehydrorhamnose 3,5-epimerase